MKWFLLFLSLFILACESPSMDPEVRAERIGKQLRCPVCRGVPIADSPSTLAVEMMDIVRTKIAEGKSDEQILKYFAERYGEWALLKPKAEGMNLLVWILPALFLIGGAIFVFYQAKKERMES